MQAHKKGTVLPRAFFERPTATVARELLGKYLVVRHGDGTVDARMIVETEAYDGFHDRASHASRGETARNGVMFGPPGFWYVYLIYGMYDMLNIVTRERGYPAAVLIRGVEGAEGPGKLTKALGITRTKFNKKSAMKAAGLWIEDRGVCVAPRDIARTPRIGVAYAGEYWAGKEWRFTLKTFA